MPLSANSPHHYWRCYSSSTEIPPDVVRICTFDETCIYGTASELADAVRRLGITPGEVATHFGFACALAPLANLEWLVSEFSPPLDPEGFRGACAAGRLDVTRWLVEKYGVPPRSTYAVVDSFLRGHFDVADWLIDSLGFPDVPDPGERARFFEKGASGVPYVKWLKKRYRISCEE